jgi:hypothetical protein
MTTDPITRKDLEYAAKAAGYGIASNEERGTYVIINGETTHWNPGNDDGDCARMEDAVGIDVYRTADYVCAANADKEMLVRAYLYFRVHANDKSRARRYASTKLAAAVGRAM